MGLSLGSLKYKAQVKDELPVLYLGNAFPGTESEKGSEAGKKGVLCNKIQYFTGHCGMIYRDTVSHLAGGLIGYFQTNEAVLPD